MRRHALRSTALAALLALACAAPLLAQEPVAQKPVLTPLSVTVTISRYQAEKRISNLPYVLHLVQGERGPGAAIANFRIGTKVPIRSMISSEKGELVAGVTYQDVGTNIDCQVNAPNEGGLFRIQITIDESSLYEEPGKPVELGRPTLRSFRTTNSLMLKDGQTAQLSSTPDRTTGEVVKVDVALTVVK